MTQHETTQTVDGSVPLTEHDRERSSGLPFFISVLAYVAAVPTVVLTMVALGVV